MCDEVLYYHTIYASGYLFISVFLFLFLINFKLFSSGALFEKTDATYFCAPIGTNRYLNENVTTALSIKTDRTAPPQSW